MSTLVSSSSSSSSSSSAHKQNKIRKIVGTWQRFARNKKSIASFDESSDESALDRHASHKLPNEGTFVVYVGKERRQYVLGEHYLKMPLFRSLLDKSKSKSSNAGDDAQDHSRGDDRDRGLFVPCEIVMFEHLLWMLDNNNSGADQSLDELVEFYSY